MEAHLIGLGGVTYAICIPNTLEAEPHPFKQATNVHAWDCDVGLSHDCSILPIPVRHFMCGRTVIIRLAGIAGIAYSKTVTSEGLGLGLGLFLSTMNLK